MARIKNNACNTGAVVMGADYRALGVVRSLGRRGIPVFVIRQPDQYLAAFSRYASGSVRQEVAGDQARLDGLMQISRKHQLRDWLLVPTDDEAVAFVGRHHQHLSAEFRLTTMPWEALQWTCNKWLMHSLADQVGVAQPWTISPGSREEVERISCKFPVILKPAFRGGADNPLTVAKAWRADNHAMLLAHYDEASKLMPRDLLMIQEVIPGNGHSQFSFTALCDDGKVRASLTCCRLRQYPMDFGRLSTYVESIEDPGIARPSVRILEALNFRGLVEIEYKYDSRDKEFKLLDINPRVWGWQTLSARAGVDYPYLLWLLMNNRPLPSTRARAGVRWVRMSTDLPVILGEIARHRMRLRTYLRSLKGPLEEAIFTPDDPVPSLIELPALGYIAAKRVIKRHYI